MESLGFEPVTPPGPILHSKKCHFQVQFSYRAQGSTMLGPTLIASFRHWLYRKEEFLLPKTPENELFALKVWAKCEKKN